MLNFLLKIIDRKKYQILKSKKRDGETQKIYLNKIIPKIKEIQNVLKNKNHISFLHSGHLGDIINSLPVIKEISRLKKCSLYIEIDKKIMDPRAITNHPDNDVFLSKNAVNKLMPLLKKQTYLSSVEFFNNNQIDIDLSFFREMPINFNIDSVRWYSHLVGLHPDLNSAYIENIPKIEKYKNTIVIMRSLRRQNPLIKFNFLNNYKNILFVGLVNEYEDLKKSIKNMEFYDSKDFIELASIIKSSKVFIGNLSFGYALAEALKAPRLLESRADFPLVYPNGEKAFEFYFQEHFEDLFKKLYKN
ncbi:MAG: hypothetical protein CBD76_02800 [Pelagibacteraceae bacterium TMED216]|nr:MAG: hypothetical protein CBD76_02800 [Pelagibacteraceae bacterium TMED216]|tara:strand:- start:2304 stop:3212 length:909 start_codon:yes stop_codon:yes gene_type:complete